MKNFILSTFILIFFTASHSAEAHKFNFISGSWEEILSKAEAEDKLIFVDFKASWCGPCKWMEKNAFNDKNTADFFNENFFYVSVDVDTEMRELVSQVNPRSVPTLIFFNSKGEIVLKDEGALGSELLMKMGQKAAGL
ncbi:thioredoxin family protein [Hyphobacterium sp. CCMP332]|nr:thioredoxin family protein [Hyphobacterium sp. CCMP332]